MQHTELDHLVIVADTLAQGRAWCEETLGVTPLPGGAHLLMGTHNCLLSIGSERFTQVYLEVIAIDPQAPPPGRPRWFNMDDPAQQQRVRDHGPELVGYVARSQMVDMHRWGLINALFQPGPILRASRATPSGQLQWQIVVPDDGRLLAGGAVPTLIQWQGPHPTAAMPHSGLSLTEISVCGMPDLAAQVLRLRPLTRCSAPAAALAVTLARADGRSLRLETAATVT